MTRVACVGLAACLLLAPGCQSGAERAGLHRQLVEIGMSRDQVEERLGEPDGWEENVNGYEVWAYSYKPSAGTFVVWRTVDAVELAVLLALVVGVFWVTRGLWSGWHGDSPRNSYGPTVGHAKDERFQRFVFRIGFSPETGRVAYVSSPLPE